MAFESFCATEQKVEIIPNIIAVVIVIVNLSPFITFVIIIVVAIILQWLLKAFARPRSRWGSDGIPTKLGFNIIGIFISAKFSTTWRQHILLESS